MYFFLTFSGIPAALCGLFLVLIIIFEIRHYIENKNKHERLLSVKHVGNLPSIKCEELTNERKNKKFVIYENYLLDVGTYIETHPGGKNLLSDNLYGDVGRYLTGNQAYSNNFHAHDHNYATYVYALKKLAYSEIVNDNNIVQTHNCNNHFLDASFQIANKREISQNIFEYRFTTNELSFSRFLTGHTWIGKHFSVTSKVLNKTRYYTTCLALDDKLKDKHMSLLHSVKDDIAVTEVINKYSNYLNLYIKRYNYPTALSNQLFKSQEEFIIRGPMV